jgi:hypothetical protein
MNDGLPSRALDNIKNNNNDRNLSNQCIFPSVGSLSAFSSNVMPNTPVGVLFSKTPPLFLFIFIYLLAKSDTRRVFHVSWDEENIKNPRQVSFFGIL